MTGRESKELRDIVEQLAAIVPKVHVAAGDPDADDDDSNTGGNGIFKSGDIWINSGDAGKFLCISAGTGAADWDEF